MKGFRPARPNSATADSAAGFTLVEIMVTIGILALFLAWGIPSVFRNLQKNPFEQSVSDLVEACSHARARAILKGDPMELIIRAEDGSITVQPAPRPEPTSSTPPTEIPSAGGVAEEPARESDMPPLNTHLAQDVAVELLDVNFRDLMSEPEARVRFFPNGTSDEFTVVLRSEDGLRTKITLDVVTGVADVMDLQ